MAQVFSLLMLIMGVAPIIAPSLGGVILGFVGWRGIFWALTACSLLCLFAAARWLPESLPASSRSRGGVKKALSTYRFLATDPWFLVHSLIAGATSFALFGYVSSAPTIFLEQHGLSPQAFSALFGCNAACLIGAAQLNRLLLRWWAPRRVVIAASTAHGIIGAVLLAAVLSNSGSLVATEIAIGLGAIAGGVIALLHDATTLPLAIVMTAGSVSAAVLSWWSRWWGEHLP